MDGSASASQLEGVINPGKAARLAVPVLPSRLAPPPVRKGTIARPALVRRLRDTTARQVVAVIAPPGYGKTTVLAQWARGDPRPFAWLWVDRRHRDPAVLVSYLATALATVIPVDPAVFDDLTAPHPLQRESAVAALARSVSRTPHPFVLVLDDAHLLTDTESLEAARTLIDHLPPESQLAVAGRAEPAIGLPRLRSEGRVLDIGADDLRLDPAGARELLAAAAGMDLPDSGLTRLMFRTEGWPVGVYFAALAGNAEGYPGFPPSAFEGDDRLLTDYIRSEVLGHLPADDVRFLTRTSVLDELSGPLCDAVLRHSGSSVMLEKIEASNLLLIPLDRQRNWYRYHHLFQAMLRHELDRAEPGSAWELSRRASAWYEVNDHFDSAVHYAQLAGDVARVGQLIVRGGMLQFAIGRAATLLEWTRWLADRGCRDGAVAVLGAWLNMATGRPDDADRWAAVAAAAPRNAEQPDGSPLEAWVLPLRAVMSQDVRQMGKDARRALQLMPYGGLWQPLAAVMTALADYYQGNLDTADRKLARAAELGASMGVPTEVIVALTTRAIIAIHHDQWDDAAKQLEQASSLIQETHQDSYPITALTYAVSARVAVHRRDPWTARRQLSSASRLFPRLTRALGPVAIQARLEYIRACITLGDALTAQDLLAEASDLLQAGRDFGTLHADARQLTALIAEARAASPRLPRLTPAELRLLPLLATQLTYQQIADELCISVHTVKAQVTSIYRKLQVSSRTRAIEQAHSLGLLPG